jgi:hypothetical protein
MLGYPRNLNGAQKRFLWVMRISFLAKVGALVGLLLALKLLGVI